MTKLSSVRLQAGIGSHVKRRAEAVRADGLILGRVISINYRKHTITYLAVATGSDNSANVRASIKNTAMLPMSMAGRNGYGKAYGSIIPIRVNDIVLVGFVNARNSSPIVVARYPDETIASELSRVDTDEVDPRSILKYAMANAAFTLYPDQTYDLHDGHGNRVLTFSGKSFLLFNSDIPKLSHYTDNGEYPKDYTNLPSSFFGNGQLIEPIADQAPEVMFKHQGIVDNQGNQDNHQLYLYISQDGNLRVSEMQKDQPWRTYFEGTAQGEIRLRRQEDSKDFASGNVNSEISIDTDEIRLRRQEDSKDFASGNVKSKISEISIDKDGQISLVDQGQGLIINKQGIYRADGTPLSFNANSKNNNNTSTNTSTNTQPNDNTNTSNSDDELLSQLNLVPNGGFVHNLDGWGISNSNGFLSLSSTPLNTVDGHPSLVANAANYNSSTGYTATSSRFSIDSTRPLSMRVDAVRWAYTDDFTISIGINWYSDAGLISYTPTITTLSPDSAWHTYSKVNISAPADAKYASIVLSIQRSGTFSAVQVMAMTKVMCVQSSTIGAYYDAVQDTAKGYNYIHTYTGDTTPDSPNNNDIWLKTNSSLGTDISIVGIYQFIDDTWTKLSISYQAIDDKEQNSILTRLERLENKVGL